MVILAKKFQRKIEDFVCEHCGAEVQGNGYTNHCPNCLWSKHVDINPGDRANHCQGLMEPLRIELDHGQRVIIYRCVKCGVQTRNKSVDNDNFEEIIKITNNKLRAW